MEVEMQCMSQIAVNKRKLRSESGCVRRIGCPVASLSADQSGQGDGGWGLWERVLMGGSMFTAALPLCWWTLRRHLHTQAQYGCHQHELPVCGLTSLSLCLVLFVCLSVRPSVWVTYCCSAFAQYVCLSVLFSLLQTILFLLISFSHSASRSVWDHFIYFFFSRCHSGSSICLAFTESSRSPAQKSCIMMFLTLFQFIYLALTISALQPPSCRKKERNWTKTFGFWRCVSLIVIHWLVAAHLRTI